MDCQISYQSDVEETYKPFLKIPSAKYICYLYLLLTWGIGPNTLLNRAPQRATQNG